MSNDLTLEEKSENASRRARLKAAELHFYDAAQPHFPMGFSISRRATGHWDVYADMCPGKSSALKAANPDLKTSESDGGRERAFRIRGEAGKVLVMDERWNPRKPHPRDPLQFRSFTGAIVYIAEELTQEPK